MPNILLTNKCNQSCLYCFAQKEKESGPKEMSLADFKVVLSFLSENRDNKVRLMGGEPTLHSKFKKIINFALRKGFSTQIFTNGIFSPVILDFLDKKKGKIKYSFNLNFPQEYSGSQWKLILNNLKTLSQYNNCLIGKVIWKKDFNIDYLLELSDKYKIKVIMLRFANPIAKRKNKFINQRDYSILARNIVCQIKKSDKIKARIGFGCGFSKNMFNKNQIKLLKEYNVANLEWGCDGNSGRFDIGTDLSVFRCFPLSNWDRKNLSDFKSEKEIESYFKRLMLKHQTLKSSKDYIHQGPCFSFLLNKD